MSPRRLLSTFDVVAIVPVAGTSCKKDSCGSEDNYDWNKFCQVCQAIAH